MQVFRELDLVNGGSHEFRKKDRIVSNSQAEAEDMWRWWREAVPWTGNRFGLNVEGKHARGAKPTLRHLTNLNDLVCALRPEDHLN